MTAKTGVLLGLADLHNEAMLTERALAEALEVSDRTIRRMVERNELPQPILLGHRRFWKAQALRTWFDRLAADTQQNHARKMAKREQTESRLASL